MQPIGITVHNTGNNAPARNEINYMLSNNNQVSYHVDIDDIEAVETTSFNRNAWHAGDGVGTGNLRTIGIEICYNTGGYDQFAVAECNAAEYIAHVLHQYGWGLAQIYRHYDWSGKNCPERTMALGWPRFLDMAQAIDEQFFSESEWADYRHAPVINYEQPRVMRPNETVDMWFNPQTQKMRYLYSVNIIAYPSITEDLTELKDSSRAATQFEVSKILESVGIDEFDTSFLSMTLGEFLNRLKSGGSIYDYIDDLNILRRLRKAESEDKLAKYLLNHPLVSDAHGNKQAPYSVSFEKQQQMVAQFTKYQLQKTAFVDTGNMPADQNKLTWNAVGEMCEEWTEAEFAKFVSQVNAYIYPIVEYQRYLEKLIYEKQTKEDILVVEIDFANYKTWWDASVAANAAV